MTSTFLHHDIYMGLTMVSSTFLNDGQTLISTGDFLQCLVIV